MSSSGNGGEFILEQPCCGRCTPSCSSGERPQPAKQVALIEGQRAGRELLRRSDRESAGPTETRLLRTGVLDRPLAELGRARRAALIAEAYGGMWLGSLLSIPVFTERQLPLVPKPKRLTERYLEDPAVRALPAAGGEGAAAAS